MAKVGQEDPRWIVEERADGTNVGNWHWQEKNAMSWSKEELTRRVVGREFQLSDGCSFRTTKLASVTGEAYWNNRKGKVFAIYELEIKVDWEGNMQIGDEEVKAKGQIHMPYVSCENDLDDFEMKITLSGSETKNKRVIKDKLHKEGRKHIKKEIIAFLENLNKCTIWELPAHAPNKGDSAIKQAAKETKAEAARTSKVEQPASQGNQQIETRTVEITERFKARPSDIFECMLDQQRVSAFTSSSCSIEPRVGGKFTLFDGMINGEYLAIEPAQTIQMQWHSKDWPVNHQSTVNIKIVEEEPGETVLYLTHKHVPTRDASGDTSVVARTKQGWKERYFMRMKMVFGFGGSFGLF